MIQAHIGEDGGDGERVADIGFATVAILAIMRLFSVEIGAPYLLDMRRIEIGGQLLTK
jgi:hypothetical protein